MILKARRLLQEQKRVILGLYWGYMGIMEKKMETTILGYIGYRIWGIWESYEGLRVPLYC